MIEWTLLGVSVAILVLAVFSATRANALFRRVKELETRLTELGDHLTEDVAEKVSMESQALRDEVGSRLGSLQECVDRMTAIETRLAGTAEREPEAVPDVEALAETLADSVRPLIREALESLDGRIRSLAETRDAGVEGAVMKSLSERGFSDVVLTREATTAEGRTKVIVEARRDGMTYKGPVILDDGRVVEQRLSPSYSMFP